MTLQQLMELQAQFDASHKSKHKWGQSVDEASPEVLEHSVVCLVGELGEFANILKKVNQGDTPYQNARDHLEEELTDVFIYLMQIANQMDVNLEESYLRKLDKNRERFKKYERRVLR
jgi:NTP pyrophosphatase (non-canonical NTP hydrolase)